LVLSRSQCPSGLRRGSTAARLLELRFQIPLGAWMSVSSECCMLSGRSLCDGPIPRPEESYQLYCVIVCDLQTSRTRWPWPTLGCCARNKKKSFDFVSYSHSDILFYFIMIITNSRDQSPQKLVNKFQAFQETGRFITAFTRGRNLFLS
jgi:hypothetical protein